MTVEAAKGRRSTEMAPWRSSRLGQGDPQVEGAGQMWTKGKENKDSNIELTGRVRQTGEV